MFLIEFYNRYKTFFSFFILDIREFTQRQEYDYDYVNGCLKGLGLIVIVIVIVSLNVGLR